MRQYKTSEIAARVGVHPNTVRLYEEWGLISRPERQKNGYRIFTDLHLMQMQLARTAFQIEILQNGLRKKIIDIVKTCAAGDAEGAMSMTREYLEQVRAERRNAEEAIEIVQDMLTGKTDTDGPTLKRKDVSKLLSISMDTLRNWEMNGLIRIKRKQNGYRVYTQDDMKRLKIIRTLRCANYSLEAILRLLQQLSSDPETNIRAALNIQDDDIHAACHRLIASLSAAEDNAHKMIEMLSQIRDLKYEAST